MRHDERVLSHSSQRTLRSILKNWLDLLADELLPDHHGCSEQEEYIESCNSSNPLEAGNAPIGSRALDTQDAADEDQHDIRDMESTVSSAGEEVDPVETQPRTPGTAHQTAQHFDPTEAL